MADIVVRRENGSPSQLSTGREMDPFRLMRSMLGWDPFREMEPYFPSLPAGIQMQGFNPDIEVKETSDSFLFKADVPGVKESDINVTLTGNRLTISGERNEEKEEQADAYYACERRYGSFTRSYTLPEGVDAGNIHADLKAGVLTVAVPKKPEVQPKKIAVKSAPTKA